MELDMLKEAIRAGISPHLIPQIFASQGNYTPNGSIYTPISPTQASSSSRMPAIAPVPNSQQQQQQQRSQQQPPPPHQQQQQQMTPFNKVTSQSSPRYLPKIDTSNLPMQGQTASTNPPAADSRHRVSHSVSDAPQSAPPHAGHERSESESSSLFFHHWQPPSGSNAMNSGGSAAETGSIGRSTNGAPTETPGSPTPRKKRMQPHILNAAAASSNSPNSRRSPSRGHSRHRSEASGLQYRFSEQYLPSAITNNNNTPGSARMSTADKGLSNDQHQYSQTPNSQEMDAARKRKRGEQEGEHSTPSNTSTVREPIPEESAKEVTAGS